MSEITEAGLREQLAAGSFSRVYLIAGEEKYLVRRAAGRLIKKAESEAFPEFNSHAFTNDSEVDSISDAAQAAPFFAEHKWVAVSDFDVDEKNSAELQKLYELLDETPDTTSLVFWYPTLDFDGKKSKKWKDFLKAAGERGSVLLCGRRTGAELQKMLLREAEKAGLTLSRQNANRILEYAGQDVNTLLHEMEKLCAYALGQAAETPLQEKRPAEITAEMIEELVPKTMETKVFLMSDALVAGNYEKAYQLLDQLFAQNEEPISILAALSSAYVDMYRVRAALESGLPAAAAKEYDNYQNREFRLRNAERNVRRMKPEVLRKSLDLLLEADMALKGSRLSKRLILEELIAKLLLAAKGERAS